MTMTRRAPKSLLEDRGATSIGDGVLVVNKAADWTSHDVVAKVRGMLKGQKVGHAGTLDPAATGVLPLLVGKGTRIAEYLVDWDKEYRAVLRLGETTDTQDATGTVLAVRPVEALTEAQIRAAVGRFQGTLRQVPPMYSAIKVGGVPLYKAARAGKTVERDARDVTVHELEILEIRGRDVELRVRCSKGTYIRTLCADIGEALGVGGHLLALERRRVGPLSIDRALSVEEIQSRLAVGRLADDVIPLDEALHELPDLVLDPVTAGRVLHGVAVPGEALQRSMAMAEQPGSRERVALPGQVVRLKDAAGRLLALGKMPAEGLGAARCSVAIVKVLAEADAPASAERA